MIIGDIPKELVVGEKYSRLQIEYFVGENSKSIVIIPNGVQEDVLVEKIINGDVLKHMRGGIDQIATDSNIYILK